MALVCTPGRDASLVVMRRPGGEAGALPGAALAGRAGGPGYVLVVHPILPMSMATMTNWSSPSPAYARRVVGIMMPPTSR
jgi:hypothetical protein